jgi:hypothetical protein
LPLHAGGDAIDVRSVGRTKPHRVVSMPSMNAVAIANLQRLNVENTVVEMNVAI